MRVCPHGEQRWAEWNCRFRDDVRRFWRGDAGMTGAFASRLCGSADLYQRSGEEPINSINFVTCHVARLRPECAGTRSAG